MSNLSAALGLAQLENLKVFLKFKRNYTPNSKPLNLLKRKNF